jgi:methylated-DNA-protein-cysteine methyltransferase-like protein
VAQPLQRPDARRAAILDRICAIPDGFVATYGDIDPAAPRMVGRVLSGHHADDLPWHRVVRADGSVAKGAEQLARLREEGVPMSRGRVDLRVARLPPEAW